MALWDSSLSSGVVIAEDALTVTYEKDAGSKGICYGNPIMKGEEEHSYTVTIHKSRYNDGGGLIIGFIDAGGEGGEKRKAWGFHPSDGKFYSVDGAGGKPKEESVLCKGGLAGQAAGATIKVIVNMKLKKAYISINGAPAIECGITLPEMVLPWTQLWWGEAEISLSEYEGPEERGSLKERLQASTSLLKESEERAKQAEAKVAEAEKMAAQIKEMLQNAPDSDLVVNLRAQVGVLETKLQIAEEQIETKEQGEDMLAKKLKEEQSKASSRNQELEQLQQQVNEWRNRAIKAEEKLKKCEDKCSELEGKENKVVEKVDAGQAQSSKLTESPLSEALGPLMKFGARQHQGSGGDYHVTAVGTVEVKMLMEAWAGGETGLVNSFVVKRVEGIKVSDTVQAAFDRKTRVVDSEMGKMKANNDGSYTDPDGDKALMMEKLTSKYARTDGLGHAKLLLAFHGCDEKTADKICNEGFASVLKDTRYGAGCKTSTCAASVCKAVMASTEPNSDGERVMIACWCVAGPVYPVSRAVDYDEGGEHSKYAGKRLKPPFMAHYCCIGPDGEALKGDAISALTDDVLVIKAHEQMVPAYRIYFTERGLD